MKKRLCLLLAALLLLSCTACGNSEELASLQAQVTQLETALAESEAQRISDAYDLQRQLESLTTYSGQTPPYKYSLRSQMHFETVRSGAS